MSENVTELLAEIEHQREEINAWRDRVTVDTATIERLREEIRHLRATLDDQMTGLDAEPNADSKLALALMKYGATHKARVLELEAEIATMRGSLAPHPADDEPGNYTHDVAPSAPR
jgi:chromosome segregation ATPase